jgi:phage terminase small subunit
MSDNTLSAADNLPEPPVLTDRQRRFVEEYLVDCNAKKAALRSGYSERSAKQAGARLRALPHVRRAIETAMAARSDRVGVTQDRVVLELARLAFADMRDFATWGEGGVRLRPSEELTEEQAACVSEIVETPGKGVRVKLHGKTQALAALARHLGATEGRKAKGAAGNDDEPADGTRPVTVVTWMPFPDAPPDEAGTDARWGRTPPVNSTPDAPAGRDEKA